MAVLGELLFFNRQGRPTLDDVLRYHSNDGLRAAVEGLPASAFNQEHQELANELARRAAIEPLKVDFENATPNVEETTVDISRSFDYGFPREGRAPGLRVTKSISFDGDPQLWSLQTNPFDMNPPRGTVEGSQVIIGTEVLESQGDAAIAYLDSTINQIRVCLQRQQAQLANYNAGLTSAALRHIRDRGSRVGRASDLLKKLGG